MTISALMFGSIGAVAETSDIQRRAYNQALKEAGLAWEWDRDTYADLLNQSGGKDRLAVLGAATGQTLSADAIDRIHARKTEIACAEVIARSVRPRPCVAALIAMAKTRGMKLAFVTTTYRPNLDAIFTAAGDVLSADDFDHIGTRDDVIHGKPFPQAYKVALAALGVPAHAALAIEDTALSVMAAKRAGLTVIATPGEITADQDFWQADLVLDTLADASGGIDTRILEMLHR